MLNRVLTGQFHEIVLIWHVSFHPWPLNKHKNWMRKLSGCSDKDGLHDCGSLDFLSPLVSINSNERIVKFARE